ncbi:MAG: hypothetical protein PHF13_06090 [Acholeplasmataceae bacterium]|jgi:hypothetical protein|nr:hypothetical protein [Acholeplasmataceae bacterium]
MSKKLHLSYLIPLAFFLSGCAFSFSPNEHDEGLDEGDIEEETIEYYDGYGDVFETEGYDAHSIDVVTDVTEQGSDFTSENQNEILALFEDDDALLSSVTSAQYVAEGVGGLKIGHLSTSINGLLDISLAASVSPAFVEIYAIPRSVSIFSQTGSYDSIDSPVAISLNDSKYVRIDTDFEDIASIEETKCSYELAEGTDHLQIEVYGQRAILTQIVIYTAID